MWHDSVLTCFAAVISQIAETLGSMSIKYQSDTKVPDWYQSTSIRGLFYLGSPVLVEPCGSLIYLIRGSFMSVGWSCKCPSASSSISLQNTWQIELNNKFIYTVLCDEHHMCKHTEATTEGLSLNISNMHIVYHPGYYGLVLVVPD